MGCAGESPLSNLFRTAKTLQATILQKQTVGELYFPKARTSWYEKFPNITPCDLRYSPVLPTPGSSFYTTHFHFTFQCHLGTPET